MRVLRACVAVTGKGMMLPDKDCLGRFRPASRAKDGCLDTTGLGSRGRVLLILLQLGITKTTVRAVGSLFSGFWSGSTLILLSDQFVVLRPIGGEGPDSTGDAGTPLRVAKRCLRSATHSKGLRPLSRTRSGFWASQFHRR